MSRLHDLFKFALRIDFDVVFTVQTITIKHILLIRYQFAFRLFENMKFCHTILVIFLPALVKCQSQPKICLNEGLCYLGSWATTDRGNCTIQFEKEPFLSSKFVFLATFTQKISQFYFIR